MKNEIKEMNKEHQIQLKKCPFCGGVGVVGSNDKGYWVGCVESKCFVQTRYFETKKEATIAWNRRIIPAGYRKQSDTVKEFAERLEERLGNIKANYDICSSSPCKVTPYNVFTVIKATVDELADNGKEEK